MALQLRARSKILPNPPILRFFSDGPGPNPQSPEPDNPNPQTPQSSFTSYFSDVKARLKQQEQQPLHRQQQRRMPTNPPSFRSSAATKPQPSWASSFEEIKKNISEFRRRSAPPVPGAEPSNAKPVEFSELYRRNVTSTGEGPESGSAEPFGKPSFDAIRDSVKKIGSRGNARRERVPAVDTLSLSRLKDTLRMRPPEDSGPKVIGGGEPLPMDIFGKEMRAKQEGKQSHDKMKREFLEMYSHSELGKRLKELRPKSVDGFSLHELNDRLVKLREMEEKMPRSPFGVTILRDLRESLETLSQAEEDKKRKSSPFKLDQLVHLGRTPDFMLHPPKEHLVEKYFHPDNMSSSEKLKIELAKVRDEFKLSESDCGSARVQVAQLTTKIKHLASVLHKKDKHSRKGLEQMVQKRKKLLKYLRRTDWESYTFVLSKLGLRDNPDIKIKH